MKCINNKFKKICCIVLCCVSCSGCAQQEPSEAITEYELETYRKDLYRGTLFADGLCVAAENVENQSVTEDTSLHGAGLFGVNEQEVLYSYQIHNRLFPASTTKILTALLALESGRLEEIVTVSPTAVNIPADSSKAFLQAGDQLTLHDLLYGLMLPSGNDAAVAIAEFLAGNEEAFAQMMNEKARLLGATNSHFVNSNGYQQENHYTTAYDLYLIFNECIKNPLFQDIVSTSEYTASITLADGTFRSQTWKQSNQFINGTYPVPPNITVIGGKTGTTNEAGACLILYSQNGSGSPYISIVMGADTKPVLYADMTSLLTAVPAS